MNPLAQQLNQQIQQGNSHVFELLSELGKKLYYPKGILTQSAEAKEKAHRFNATIGIAIEGDTPMHLSAIQDHLSDYDPKDLYPYASPAGKPELRQAWKEKMLLENPALSGKKISHPVVTNALTHGLSIVSNLFVNAGDTLILPDKLWGNYNLTFGVFSGANVTTFPFYNEDGGFNTVGLKETLLAQKEKGKAIVLLNFPNNPTGYTPTESEAQEIVLAIQEAAESGINLVVVTDDAYFGLFFEDSIHESLFGRIAGLHPRVLAVKVDGATKEDYVWGFRVGFITFASSDDQLLKALESKTMGSIRGQISSCSHPSQTFVLKALQDPGYKTQKQEKFQILKDRANLVKKILDSGKYEDAFSYYPFNSGYFMCLKLNKVDADILRLHLLDHYGVGTISIGATDLRVAFSCVELEDIEELFALIYQGAKDLEQ
ncbi:aminotransferase class I/II-fold pyridoxal phosphate-dependent enzyme [Bacillus horti]|uniref:Aspartate/methionine/tyrosine aminotransferase n=1 Tax=Caldalkalibacillus horti TaxID=77523 RepID=A0ABT9VSZ3_9BACI|nr:aminotransferase class I/II-fold pyridoxal phosphate-dependent enzyme [Bacillus horti]MDQ0164110.1 aspartate/methionine/tyrosine aminotransferase [Bacillus horti]